MEANNLTAEAFFKNFFKKLLNKEMSRIPAYFQYSSDRLARVLINLGCESLQADISASKSGNYQVELHK